MKKTAAFATCLMLGLPLAAARVQAADHKDSPAVERDPATDINDVYAFRNGDNLVVALTVQSLLISNEATDLFNPSARYQIFVDNTPNNALAPDATVTVTFSGTHPQMFSVAGLTASPIVGPTSGFADAAAPRITTSGVVKAFAGIRDDPFFFDLAGFREFLGGTYTPVSGLRSSTTAPARDSFLGLNCAAIVLEFPITAVNGNPSNPNTGTIKAWAATSVLQ